MSAIIKEYRSNPSGVAFHESKAKIKAIMGPMGSGKSTLGILEWFFMCQESDIPLRGVVIRESYRQLKDSTKKTYEEWLGPVSVWSEQDAMFRMTIPNYRGSVMTHELWFRHCRRAEEATNFLSTELAFIWLEECVPAFQKEQGVIGCGLPEGLFTTAVGRLRQSGAVHLLILLTFNPPSKYHWTYKQFLQPTIAELADNKTEVFIQPPGENSKNLPADYYDSLRKVMNPDQIKRFVDGEVYTVYPGKPVFDSFSESIHFRSGLQLIPGRGIITMHDFGVTPNCLFSQIDNVGRLRIYREIQMWNNSAEQMAAEVNEVMRTEYRGYTILRSWGDPAGSQRSQADLKTVFQVMQAAGIPVQPSEQSWSTRFNGVDRLSRRIVMGEPAILIDRDNCPTLMEALTGGYRYRRGNSGQLSSMPEKNSFSHIADALQYGIVGEYNVSNSDTKHDHRDADQPRKRRYNPLADEPKDKRPSTWMGR